MKTADERRPLIDTIRVFPEMLSETIAGLDADQLNLVTIPDEWTVQQIVHHLPDSHMNAVIRLKLILTADRPHLQGYDQAAWALLPDVANTPIEASLSILRGLHARWVNLWESLTDDQWQRVGIHSERGPLTPDDLLVLYDDHCKIHLDQIRKVRAAMPQ